MFCANARLMQKWHELLQVNTTMHWSLASCIVDCDVLLSMAGPLPAWRKADSLLLLRHIHSLENPAVRNNTECAEVWSERVRSERVNQAQSTCLQEAQGEAAGKAQKRSESLALLQAQLEHEQIEQAQREKIESLKAHLQSVIDRTTRIRTAYEKEKKHMATQVSLVVLWADSMFIYGLTHVHVYIGAQALPRVIA